MWHPCKNLTKMSMYVLLSVYNIRRDGQNHHMLMILKHGVLNSRSYRPSVAQKCGGSTSQFEFEHNYIKN